jgi:hypothetical protein
MRTRSTSSALLGTPNAAQQYDTSKSFDTERTKLGDSLIVLGKNCIELLTYPGDYTQNPINECNRDFSPATNWQTFAVA